jgi:hypothetical protein
LAINGHNHELARFTNIFGANVRYGSMLSKNSLFEGDLGDALSGQCVPNLRSNR